MTSIQRRLASMGAMLAVAGIVGAIAYFGTFKGKQKEEEDKQKEEKVAAFEKADEVTELTLATKGTILTAIADGEGEHKWRLTSPTATPADKTVIEGIITHFADMKRKRAFDAQPTDLKAYGLDPAIATLTMKTKAGEETFKIGKKNSFDENVYLQKGSDAKVAMVPNAVTGFVEKDLFALREKRVVPFEDKDVQTMEVELAGKPAYVLEKRGEDWFLKSPIEARAEKAQVTTLLSSLHYMKASAFATEKLGDAKALQTYGLGKPAAAVTLSLGAAKVRVIYGFVGEKKYAMVEGVQNPVLEVGEDVAKKFGMSVSDLRDKTLSPFAREAAAKIELHDESGVVTLEKKKGDKDDKWLFADGKETQDGRVSSLLWKLSSLRSKEIQTDKVDAAAKKSAGLEPPARTIKLWDDAGKEIASFAFGPEKNGQFSALADNGKRIDLVDQSALAEVKFEAKDYAKADPVAAGTPPENP